MRVKNSSVDISHLDISMREVFKHLEDVYAEYAEEPVITAGMEVVKKNGEFIHSASSLHPFGMAVDVRHRYFSHEERKEIQHKLQERLGDDYDVVLELTHFHIEYDPK